jgi:hypothetical protein
MTSCTDRTQTPGRPDQPDNDPRREWAPTGWDVPNYSRTRTSCNRKRRRPLVWPSVQSESMYQLAENAHSMSSLRPCRPRPNITSLPHAENPTRQHKRNAIPRPWKDLSTPTRNRANPATTKGPAPRCVLTARPVLTTPALPRPVTPRPGHRSRPPRTRAHRAGRRDFSVDAYDGDHFFLVPREADVLADGARRMAPLLSEAQ